jgi:zinc-binding in reverse transcriptase
MYTFLYFGGIHTLTSHLVWSLKISLKHKLFLWLTLHNKILTKDNLRKKGWLGDVTCSFCTNSESVNHLFFTYSFIAPFWRLVLHHHPQGHLLDSSSLLYFWHSCLKLPTFQFWGILLAPSLWISWLEHNKRVFTTSSNPRVVGAYFLILQLFQFWIGSSFNLEQILVVAVEPAIAPYGEPDRLPPQASASIGTITSLRRVDGGPSTLADVDEDLLDS